MGVGVCEQSGVPWEFCDATVGGGRGGSRTRRCSQGRLSPPVTQPREGFPASPGCQGMHGDLGIWSSQSLSCRLEMCSPTQTHLFGLLSVLGLLLPDLNDLILLFESGEYDMPNLVISP